MKRHINCLIEKEIINLAEAQARREGRLLNDLIQNAVTAHLQTVAPDSKIREKAYRLFCEQPIQRTREQFDAILNEDPEAG